MKLLSVLLIILFGLSLAFTGFKKVAGTHAPQADSLQLYLPSDLQVELWAESPQFYNPTNIDVDVKGRIWVTEAANYRNYNNDPKKFLHHEAGDRVMILEDTDGDGKSDKSKVFVQDTDLVSPLGIAVIGNKVIVSCSPNLIIYTDENGDDKPDKKEIFLTGFGGRDHDHSLHSLIAGPDGKWYFNTGNAGPHVVKDRSGFTLRSGSLYTGGSPYNKQNEGGMVSDDGKIYVGGLALRINPDGKGLKVLGHNFRNAYELALDSYGNMWQNDNDDQVITCRTTWLMEGGNAGYFSADGTRYWQGDLRPGQSTFTAHWHQEDPGVIPAGDNTGAGSPTGVVIYESDDLGKNYRGMLLSADAGRNVIFGYHPKPSGAGYLLNRWNLITSIPGDNEKYVWNDTTSNKDNRKWFRPSDVAVGTDGAIYIADWYDPIVGGHQMKEQNGYGRIYRITPKNKRLNTPVIDINTVSGQITALKSPAINVRNLGFEKLRAQGEKSIASVKELLDDENHFHRARAIWLLSKLGEAGIKETEKLLTSDEPELRITAFRALRQAKADIMPYVNKLLADSSIAVRRELAIALKNVPLTLCRNAILSLASSYKGNDRWFLEALGYAIDGREEEVYLMLAQHLGDVDPGKWTIAFADLTWRLHPRSAVKALSQRATAAGVSDLERKRAVVALAFIKDRAAADAMKALGSSNVKAVADEADWWFNFRKTNDWFAFSGDQLNNTTGKTDKEMLMLQKRIVDQSASLQVKTKAALQMARDPQGGQLLINLASEGKLSNPIRKAVSQSIFENPDRAVRVQAGEYFERPGLDKKFSIAAISRLKPEASKGRTVFTNSCASCHKAGKIGNKLGPELTAIRSKYDRASLLDAIVNPSAGIVFGYEPWLVSTKDGKSYYGFMIAQGQTVVVRDMAGEQHAIPALNIKSKKKMPGSLMPDPGALNLDEKKLADVTEFLLTLSASD